MLRVADRPTPTTLPAARPSRWRPRSGQTRSRSFPREAARVWPLLLVAILVAVAGCQSTKTTSPRAAPASVSATPTPTATATPAANPAVAARDAAIAAYKGMWAAYETAGTTANPDEPTLATYATGRALTTLQNGLRTMLANDQVARGTVILHPSVVSVSPADAPTQIEITDCADTTAAVLYHRGGGPVNDTPGGHRRVNASVIATDGTWKVDSFGVLAVGSCTGT